MATITLQHPDRVSSVQQRRFFGRVTGNAYSISPIGQATVDTRDSAQLLCEGWIQVLGSGSLPASGVATLDFGAFPGSASPALVVAAADVADPNAVLDAWIIPVATVDHTADEHAADPPRVIATNTTPGTSITIYGFPSGRDLPVPPGTPFGNTANSQMPVAQQQLMPVGKWSVAWAFSP